MQNITLKTKRLILRPWKMEDLEPFSKLNADPRVMECFPSILSRHESDQLAKKIIDLFDQNGWGLWAVSIKNGPSFIGFIGLAPVKFTSHFTPAIEIGWRIAYEFWGKGYATEDAKACLAFAFETLHLPEIVSFTVPDNKRSRKVMEKIGLHYDPKDDFDHPLLAEGHALKRHVLYRINAKQYFSEKKS